jgi:predicted DNA-binding transcriptional regulator AlpA
MSDRRLDTAPRRGLRRDEAAQYLALSPSKFDELVHDGRMPKPIHIDRISVWDVRDLDRAFDALKDGPRRNPWNQEDAA